MILSYTSYLLIFTTLNAMIFLLIYEGHRSRIAKLPIFAGLLLILALFLYLIIYNYSFLGTNITYAYLVLGISMSIAFLFYLAKSLEKRSIRLFIIIMVFTSLLSIVFETSLLIMSGFIEVSEQTPDAVVYTTYGHWSFSLKNPYYDIINVASYWIALLHMVFGINDITCALPNMILYFIIALLTLLSAYLIYERMGCQNLILPAIAIALATPYIMFTMIPPALSAMFAILVISFFTKRSIKIPDYIAIILLSIAGILTHATAIAMLIFSLLALYLLSRLYREDNLFTYLRVLMLLTVLYLIISLIRFFYTTAYMSLHPYYADFLRFLNFLLFPDSVELRVTRYEQLSPIFTSYSWTLHPALAASYTIAKFFKRGGSHNDIFALALLSAGLILIFTGFIGSYFSNSFSREVAYTGYMLLFLGSFNALKQISNDKVGRLVMLIMIVVAVFSGLFTVKNAPWLYVGKMPFIEFRPPTSYEISMVEDLLRLANKVEYLTYLKIYQEFNPEIFVIKLIEWGWIKPGETSSHNIHASHLSELGNVNVNNIVFNANSVLMVV